MAKKSSVASKPAKKPAPPKRASKSIAGTKAKAVSKAAPKKKPVKKAATSTTNTAPAKKKSTAKIAVVKMPAAKTTVKKSKTKKAASEGYLATLNHWRQSAVAGVRTIVQKPAATTRGLWQHVPAPRKLLHEAGAKLRHVNLANLKDVGKKELQELVHLAARLSEISRSPSEIAKSRGAKRK